MNELPLNQILCGNCVEVLKDFPDDSIDLVVTDPPYGLSFMGKDWDKTLPPREAFDEIIRVLKPGALGFVMSSPRQDVLWRMLALLEGVGFELTQSYIEWIYKTGFPKAYDVSKGIDNRLGKERRVIKTIKKLHLSTSNTNEGWQRPSHYDLNGKSKTTMNITEPNSELAKTWNGWKSQTGLKPAHEPILMVNKPFSESTIVDNVLKWGTGAINVDACRIPFKNEADIGDPLRFRYDKRMFNPEKGWNKNNMNALFGSPVGEKGRFPANLLVSDKAIDTGELTKSGAKLPHHIMRKVQRNAYGEYAESSGYNYYEDVGDQSRYFDLDAWAEHHGFLDVPKPSKAERDFGLQGFPLKNQRKQDGSWGSHEIFEVEGSGRKTGTVNRNYHPTVKPIQLMAYLIELGCPPDGVVLDPFVGSGTTCIAAKKLVRRFIGIEVNPEYCAMARARVDAYPVPLSWFMGSETQDVLVPPRVGGKEE